MSLIGTLNIGKTAMAVTQAAIQTTGNNISNAGNADYTRQVANVSPNKSQQVQQGIYVGTGISLDSVQRQIDEALEGRIRGSISDDQSANVTQQWLGRVESVFNELTDQDLSTQLSNFFNSWSNLANKPQDIGLRQVVIQNGSNLGQSLQEMYGQLGSLQDDVDNRLEALTQSANAISQQIADLNGEIVRAEGGAIGSANGLRDQRDALLKQLSGLIDIKTVTESSGLLNVYVGSEPLILGTDNRGVGFRTESVDGKLEAAVTIVKTDSEMKVTAGQLGALDEVRTTIAGVIDQVNTLAGTIIFELNKIHSSGQGLEGFSSVSASNLVDNVGVALNHDDANLAFAPVSGSFVVHVKNQITGLTSSTLVQVDLDGQNGNDTTLQTLQASLDGIADISATLSGGRLSLSSDSTDVQFSFSQDSSGVLAALGINTFFSGTSAQDMAINATISGNPSLLSAARNGERGDNQTATTIASLESKTIQSLHGASLKQTYEAMVNGVAIKASSARTRAEAASSVRATLEAQREALSGVSLDEEAVNLMRQQRAFQGAARLISAVDEMMRTLLSM